MRNSVLRRKSKNVTEVKERFVKKFEDQFLSIAKKFDQEHLEQIYDIGDILNCPLKYTQEEIDEIISFLIYKNPNLQPQFDFLDNRKRASVVSNIYLDICERGQQIFKKGEKCNFAYLVLYGQIGFYNDIKNPLWGQNGLHDHSKMSKDALKLQEIMKQENEKQNSVSI